MKKIENYNLNVLLRANQEDLENEFIISGIINKFFIQFELGRKVMRDLMKYEGKSIANTDSPREILTTNLHQFITRYPLLCKSHKI